MRRIALFLAASLAAALALLPAGTVSAKAQPSVLVRLGSTYVEGRNWPTGETLTATLRNRQGEIKGRCATTPGSCFDGYESYACWGCGFDQGVAAGSSPTPRIKAGDTISIEQGGVTTTSARLADVAVTDVNTRADTVSGLTTPPRKQSFVRIQPGGYLTAAGWVNEPPYEVTGKIAADGGFTVDTTGTGNLRRRDWGYAGYVAGVFRVVRQFEVPSLQVSLGEPGFWFSGLPGAEYTLQLLDRSGRVKSEMQLHLDYDSMRRLQARETAVATSRAYGDLFAFLGSYGRRIRIREGYKIRVRGPGGFTLAVPRLRIDFLELALGVRTRGNQPYEANAWLPGLWYGWSGQTDAAGVDTHDLPVSPLSAWARVVVNGCSVETNRIRTPAE